MKARLVLSKITGDLGNRHREVSNFTIEPEQLMSPDEFRQILLEMEMAINYTGALRAWFEEPTSMENPNII